MVDNWDRMTGQCGDVGPDAGDGQSARSMQCECVRTDEQVQTRGGMDADETRGGDGTWKAVGLIAEAYMTFL